MSVFPFSPEGCVVTSVFSGLGKRSIIFPAALLAALGIGLQSLGIVFFAHESLGASATQVGCLAATWSLSYVFGCFCLGGVSGRMAPRLSCFLALCGMCLAVLGVSFSRTLAPAFGFYLLFGLSTAFFWPPLMGWLSLAIEGRDLGRAMGIFNVCWSTGAVVGPLLAGYLSEMDRRAPLLLAAGAYFIAAAWVLCGMLFLPRVRADVHASASLSSLRVGREGTPLRYPSWGGLFAAYVVFGVVLNVFPLSAPAEFGIGKGAIGVLFLARGLATTLGLALLGRSQWWHFRGWQLAAGHAVFAVTMVLMAAVSTVSAACVVLVMIGVLIAHAYSNSLFHGVAGSRSRASRMAVHEGLLSAGLVCGGAVGGAVFDLWGVDAVYLGCATVLCAVALLESLLLVRASRRGTGLGIALRDSC